MKKLFSLLSMLSMSMVMFAQGSLLATLSHDGNISVYYGASALKDAYNAAANGDVITLSSGQYNATDIKKAITLRGAGMSVSTDSINAHEATIVQGRFTINIADTAQSRVCMEGLYFQSGITYAGNLKNAQFLKCRFENLLPADKAVISNSSFIHCRFYNGYRQWDNSNVFFINCAVCNPCSNSSTSNIEFDNCFVKFDYYNLNGHGAFPQYVINSYYKNCIIQVCNDYTTDTYYTSIPYSCTAFNCIGLGKESIFQEMSKKNKTNKYVSDISKVFKTYSNTNSQVYIKDYYSFELTDTAATTYLGTDGTQVGVYGGNLPYDENPTIPQITKCNVASKSTPDGKLSVDIEVKAAEY